MDRFVTIGKAAHPVTPYTWQPRTTPPRFVALSPSVPVAEDAPTPSVETPPVALTPSKETPVATPTPSVEDFIETPTEPLGAVIEETGEPTPLSVNLLNIRRALSLTPEEFARPIIDDGEGLINRLEAGFSRASAEVSRLICDAWFINQKYLFTGHGPMFEKDSPGHDYCGELVLLLKQYLKVATFDRKGNQYWKGSLVNDLMRLIDTGRLTGAEAARIIRVVYDSLDAEQFEELLERMGRLYSNLQKSHQHEQE